MILPTVEGGFAALHVDCPWRFETYDRKSAVPTQAADPYPTMSLRELAGLPVDEITAKRALMIMWIIDSHLDQAMLLGKIWGFTFKTIGFIWVKEKAGADQIDLLTGECEAEPKMSMGHWTRKQAEIALLFTKGQPPRLSGGVRQVIYERPRQHSRKPAQIYPRIEALVGGPYLDLFGRAQRPGWTIAGNDTNRFTGA